MNSTHCDSRLMKIKTSEEAGLLVAQIPGVTFKILKSFPDDRGFFRELIRHTDDIFRGSEASSLCFAQWSHSKMGRHTVKAWHYHHRQIDWWYVPIGVAKVALCDFRPESPTYKKVLEFKLGEPEVDPEALCAVVRIPQGVLHGCRVLSEFAHLFYITSEIYNPEDEGRYPFNSPEVPYSWGDEKELIVAPNDKKAFVPTQNRITL